MKTSDRVIVFACICALALCSPPPTRILPDQGISWSSSLCSPHEVKSVKGYGSITWVIDEERFTGTVDMQQRNNGSVRIDLYGPLGMAVASFESDSSHCVMEAGGRTHSFLPGDRVDSMLIPIGGGLTCGELVDLVAGILPKKQRDRLCKTSSESLMEKRNTIITRWKTDSVYPDLPWTLFMSGFQQGRAKKIELKQDNGNYFLIRYKKLRFR